MGGILECLTVRNQFILAVVNTESKTSLRAKLFQLNGSIGRNRVDSVDRKLVPVRVVCGVNGETGDGREIDEVAYVRYASVYRSFEDVSAFADEIERLRHAKVRLTDNEQLSLLNENEEVKKG